MVLLIVIIILYAIATIIQLVRYIQTQNGLHLLLFISSLTVIVVIALMMTGSVNEPFTYNVAPFIFLVVGWITIFIPTYLLFIWMRPMRYRLQRNYKQYFKSVKACFVLFTLTKLFEWIGLVIYKSEVEESGSSNYRDRDGYERGSINWYFMMLFMKTIIELIFVCYPGLFCISIRHKFRGTINPESRRKRRQLTRIFLLYLVQFIYLAVILVTLVIAFSSSIDRPEMVEAIGYYQIYAVINVLFLYLLLTVFPRDAITGFDKMPDQLALMLSQPVFVTDQPIVMTDQPTFVMDRSTSIPAQPTVMRDQPAVVTAQPTAVMDQPTVVPGQPAFVPGQPTFVMDQPTSMLAQPTAMTDQPTFMPVQPTVVMDQPTVAPGQPTFVMEQPTVVMGQPTVVQDQPTFVPGQPIVVTGQPTYVQGQPNLMPSQPL
jgi:hypothetical protein